MVVVARKPLICRSTTQRESATTTCNDDDLMIDLATDLKRRHLIQLKDEKPKSVIVFTQKTNNLISKRS